MGWRGVERVTPALLRTFGGVLIRWRALPPPPLALPHLPSTELQPLLTEIITKERLKANCRFCETAGSQFVYRPICGTC